MLGVVVLPGVVASGTDVGVLGMLLPVGTLMFVLVLVLVLLGAESLGLPLELGIASLAGVVDEGVVASVALGFFLMLVAGFFLMLVAGFLVVSLPPGVVVLGVVVLLGVDCISPPAGVVVEEGVVVSVAGFLSMLLAGFSRLLIHAACWLFLATSGTLSRFFLGGLGRSHGHCRNMRRGVMSRRRCDEINEAQRGENHGTQGDRLN